MRRLVLTHVDVDLVADVDGPDAGPTVLFLHGGAEQRTVWRPIARRVAGAGWRTVAPDCRGHGESARVSRYALDDMVGDAAFVVRQLGGRPLVVVGGSIGGAVGLILAGERGVDLDGLVLVDVSTAPRPEAAQRQRTRIARAQAGGEPALASLDPEVMGGSFVDEVVADLGRWRRAARQVRVPVLVVRGGLSPAVRERELAAFAEDVPHGEVVEVAGAGHLVAREQPAALAAHLLAFLARLRS